MGIADKGATILPRTMTHRRWDHRVDERFSASVEASQPGDHQARLLQRTAAASSTQRLASAVRALYRKLGYTETGIVPCDFNGIEGIRLVLLEKPL